MSQPIRLSDRNAASKRKPPPSPQAKDMHRPIVALRSAKGFCLRPIVAFRSAKVRPVHFPKAKDMHRAREDRSDDEFVRR
jgi:hypothetical protein